VNKRLMAIEIERKFLVTGNDWRQSRGVYCVQGYLSRDKDRTIRVRRYGNKAFLTVKGVTTSASRAEFEYEIPLADAEELFKLCDGPLIEKVRHRVFYNGLTWDVDEFLGENEGLVLAEIELDHEAQSFERPPWLGEEVTHDHRYFNSNLCAHPFRRWSKGE